MNSQNRWHSYVLWAAVASLVGMALLDFGVIKDLTKYDKYIDAILGILILAGIINNPTNKSGL